MEYKSIYKSKIGNIILTSDGDYLTGLWFDTSRFIELRNVTKEQIKDELGIFKITKNWLDRYFNGDNPNQCEIPIKQTGSDFSLKVWDIIKKIPYGKTITYGDIAKMVAKENNVTKMSSQAVGHAVGHNPLCILVPCHRVVGANNNLVGYGGGLDIKIKLLEIEGIDIKNYTKPLKGNAL